MWFRRILPNLALLLASLALALGVAELALRARFGPAVHWKYPQEHYVYDPELGHWLRPDQRAYTHDRVVEVNSAGIRDADYPKERPPGTRRVLALGDSQTFGSGLALAETWPKQLEAELRKRAPGTRWQVLNAGLSATDTWQHEPILERLTQAYEVDGVVLAFYTNDVSPRPRRISALSPAARTNTGSKRLGYLAKRSAVFTALWQARGPVLAWLRPDPDLGRERRVLSGEPDPVIERGWEQVERSLAAMQARTQEIGAAFVLLVLPRRDQVDGSEPVTAYNRRIGEIAARLGIPAVDVLAPLRDAYEGDGDSLFIPWDGHNSALANERIAASLAPTLLGLLPDPPRPAEAAP